MRSFRIVLAMMWALVLLLPLVQAQIRVDPLVEIENGLIRGLRSDDGQYAMFLGIPYGVVDSENPFGPATPHPGFNTTFEAYDDSVICPQISSNGVTGTINCLNLNIYVPSSATSRNRLPVMVWLHGGSFVEGSGNRELYSPEFLIRHDVIFVSLNYRLGPYGFICPDVESVAGNQGLKDQLLALRWIKQHIQAFGGDISKLTVFGIDSGAESINLHLVSPHEKLIDRAIVQSAPRFDIGAPNNAVPLAIAQRLGYETQDVNDAVSFLSSQDYTLVIAAFDDLRLKVGPCLESDYEGVEKFIGGINKDKIKNTPIIIGYTNNEMQYEYANVNPDVFVNFSFENELKIDSIEPDVVDFVRHFYTGDEELSERLGYEIINFVSDFNYYHPTERLINKYTAEEATVFYYVFSYDGDRNYMKKTANITEWGATHMDELGYLFGSAVPGQPTGEDYVVVDKITILWTNFAKFGDPTPEETDILQVKWTPVSSNNRWYLEIHSYPYLQSRPFYNRMAFWDLFYKIQETPEN